MEEDYERLPRSLNLKMFRISRIPFNFYEMLPLCGIGISESFNVFMAYHNQLYFASRFLVMSTEEKTEDSNNDLMERYMYLQAAIVSYNSCLDYVYQIIYFYYDLFSLLDNKCIDSRESIYILSTKVKGRTLDRINIWLQSNPTTKYLANLVEEYKTQMEALNNKANEIKHRGRYHIEGLTLKRSTMVKKVLNGNELNITSIVTPEGVDFEYEIDYLIEIHNKSMDMQSDLFKFLDYSGQLKKFLKSNGVETNEEF